MHPREKELMEEMMTNRNKKISSFGRRGDGIKSISLRKKILLVKKLEHIFFPS